MKLVDGFIRVHFTGVSRLTLVHEYTVKTQCKRNAPWIRCDEAGEGIH